jgi:hypothetical protein
MKFLCTNLLFISFLFSIDLPTNNNLDEKNKYFSGENGIIHFYINVWGFVNAPGRIIVNEGDDIITAISLGGGTKDGANFKKIKIYRQNSSNNESTYHELDLNDYLSNKDKFKFAKLKPSDVIIVDQKISSLLFNNISIYNSLLSFIVLFISISNQ